MQTVTDLADKIYKDLEVKSGELSVKEKADPYFNNLPETLTKDTVEAVHGYNEVFVAAGVHAAGRIAIEAMKKDKHTKIVSGQIGMVGKDYIAITAERDRSFPIPGKDGEVTTKPIHITQKLHVQGVRNVGNVSKVHDALTELAESAFK